MPDPQEPRNPSIALPVDLVGEERDEAERIVRITRRALADAFARIGVDAVPRVPNYATRSEGTS